MKKRDVKDLLNDMTQAIEKKDYPRCIEAVKAIGQTGAKEAVPHLVDLMNGMKDKHYGICIEAVKAIGQTGAKEAVPHLVDLMNGMKGKHDGICDAAKKAINDINREVTIDKELLDIAEHEPPFSQN